MTSESSFSTCSSDSCSESESSPDSSEYVSAVEKDSVSEFLPYDDDIESIATEKKGKDMWKKSL